MARLDLVIFGATGFTGKHAVQELCRISKKHTGLTWGVAGRSQTKLEDMLKEISKKTDEDLSSVTIIVADVQDEESLKEMCLQCKVVVNCCGPYRHYGEPVVKAAIDNKTHYVDVSAEPQFIQSMHLEYDKAARDVNVYVIPACGFASIPIDMGVVFLQQNFGGILNSVVSYLTTYPPADMKRNSFVNYGTWESLIYSLRHFRDIPTITKKLYPRELPDFKPKLKSRFVIHKIDNAWSVPYFTADASIVYRTQRYFYETDHTRPVQIKTYVTFPNLLATLAIVFAAVSMFLMSIFSCTMNFVLKNPNLFTFGAINKKKQAPSEQAINATKFKFQLYGEGWEAGSDVDTPPNKRMVAQVSGVNPYSATAVAVLYSAITILEEKHNMPQCGVLTTGAAYRNTNIIKQLNENNLKFQILDNK